MAKWVTFYDDMIRGRYDFTIHKDKATATEYFKQNYKKYFAMAQDINVKLPMRYGFAFRAFVGVSLKTYNEHYKEA